MVDLELKKRIIEALADMDSKIIYDPIDHNYKHAKTGDWLQGVSSVSSIVPKDWLAAWGAKETVKFLGYSDYEDLSEASRVLEKIKGMNVDQYVDFLHEAKGASKRKSNQALLDGKKGHEWLEMYVKSKLEGSGMTIPLPIGDLNRPIQQFLEWEAEHIDEWIASEARVIHEQMSYAGTFDGVAILKNGKLALIDFKFATNVSEDYHLQLAGYAACFEPYGIKFDERIVLRLPKTLEKDEWKNFKYVKVQNNIEDYRIWTPYEKDKVAFFGALPVKQWINMVQAGPGKKKLNRKKK